MNYNVGYHLATVGSCWMDEQSPPPTSLPLLRLLHPARESNKPVASADKRGRSEEKQKDIRAAATASRGEKIRRRICQKR